MVCRVWRTWHFKNRFRSIFWRFIFSVLTTLQSDWTGLFGVRGTSFHICSLLKFFLCFIVLFQSCCSHARVFGKTLVHEFLIFYSHTEWNFLSLGTITLFWWRACYKKLNKEIDVRSQHKIGNRRIKSTNLPEFLSAASSCVNRAMMFYQELSTMVFSHCFNRKVVFYQLWQKYSKEWP